MNSKKISFIAIITSLYVVLCLVLAPISYGQIQVRIAEAFTILPLIRKDSIYALTLGCFLSNLIGALMGMNPTGLLDALIGTLATFLAANLTYYLRNFKVGKIPLISLLSPVIINFLFVGSELAYLYMPDNFFRGLLIFGGEVAVGETIAVIIGYLILPSLMKAGFPID